MLLKAGAEVDKRTKETSGERTALWIARENRKFDIEEVLLAAGADPSLSMMPPSLGMDPAMQYGHAYGAPYQPGMEPPAPQFGYGDPAANLFPGDDHGRDHDGNQHQQTDEQEQPQPEFHEDKMNKKEL